MWEYTKNPGMSEPLESRLRAYVPQPVSEQDASNIKKFVDLINAENRLPGELSAALVALEPSFKAANKWGKATKQIGMERNLKGRSSRTVLRLKNLNNKKSSPSNNLTEKLSGRKDSNTGYKSSGSSSDTVTAACAAQARNRVGRVLKVSVQPESDAEFMDRYKREAQEHFSAAAREDKLAFVAMLAKTLDVPH